MRRTAPKTLRPSDTRALVAVDLGAGSCRVSLLRWVENKPQISLVHRFANAPREVNGGLFWDLTMITEGLETGLRKAAEIATEGVRAIAVDGWAVDYVRVDTSGNPLGDPYCYRDERTIKSEKSVHRRCSPDRMRELTGIQLIRINSLYQLHADQLAGLPEGDQWMNLPEYFLSRWGGARVAELTNATHTQLVELYRPQWCHEIFTAVGLDLASAPKIVPPGSDLGEVRGPLAELPAFKGTRLIAPGCHDTASAIAGIPASGRDWAYISSGTWSLVGTLLEQPRNSDAVKADNFTNLGAVGSRICFHKNVNGMWLIEQSMAYWAAEGKPWNIADLIKAAEQIGKPDALLDVDDEDLLLPERMPERINAQRTKKGLPALDTSSAGAPVIANLIFYSLAARYAKVLDRISLHSGKKFKRLYIVGGASQNEFLNRLTAEATGLDVHRGAVESSTIGNFAVQMACLEGMGDKVTGVFAESVVDWAGLFCNAAMK